MNFKHIENLKYQLRKICVENKINATRMLQKSEKYKYLLDFIETNVSEKIKSIDYPLKMKIYWVLNSLTDFPKCQVCSKPMLDKNYHVLNGHKKTCSYECSRILAKENNLKTCLKKYGLTNGGGTKQSLRKIRETSLKKFGTTNVFSSDYGKAKIQQTNLKKYGEKFYGSTKDHKEKFKHTMLLKYGVQYPLQSKKILNKMFKTNILKFNVKFSSQCSAVRKKQQARYKYDNLNFDSLPEIAYYIWLKDHNIDFEYQPNIKLKYIFEDKVHFYFPDFKVGNQFIEIKGDQFFKDGLMINPYDEKQNGLYEAKHQCMISNNVKILKNKDYKKYLDYIFKKYGNNYLKQFKNK